MNKRSLTGQYMLGWCKSARGNIDIVESTMRQAGDPVTIHLGAELANTRDAIAELEEQIKEWMK